MEFADQSEIALSISKGTEEKSSINPAFLKRKRKKRPELSVEQLAEGVLSGDRGLLSQAITLVESAKPDHRQKARDLVKAVSQDKIDSTRIGITGVPGVGKSTFIEAFGIHLCDTLQKKVAVLAVDPSSQRSAGSILGDKTRMANLAVHPNAFIRPSPSACSLGGVAEKTRETVLLCEAAGFDTILIETVGVGQSETTVHGMVDFFLLLMLAGAGDELQGIKRGIMEMADGMAITKADGQNIHKARAARVQYENALHLFPDTGTGWIPKSLLTSSLNNEGIDDVWNMIEKFKETLQGNGAWALKRKEQGRTWMKETILQQLLDDFYNHPEVKSNFPELENGVANQQVNPFEAAQKLMGLYKQ